MKHCPKIGDRVHYLGGLVTGPCDGVVYAIYPTDEQDEHGDLTGRVTAEAEWHVGVRVDILPTKFPYKGNRFAPEVSRLTYISP